MSFSGGSDLITPNIDKNKEKLCFFLKTKTKRRLLIGGRDRMPPCPVCVVMPHPVSASPHPSAPVPRPARQPLQQHTNISLKSARPAWKPVVFLPIPQDGALHPAAAGRWAARWAPVASGGLFHLPTVVINSHSPCFPLRAIKYGLFYMDMLEIESRAFVPWPLIATSGEVSWHDPNPMS